MTNEINCNKFRKQRSNLVPKKYWLSDRLDRIEHIKNMSITVFGVTQAIRKPTCPGRKVVRCFSLQDFFRKYLWPKKKQNANKEQDKTTTNSYRMW